MTPDPCSCGKTPKLDWLVPALGAKSKAQVRVLCPCGKATPWHGGTRDLSRVKRNAVKDWKGIVRVATA